jgi:hypothetical protein
LVVAVTELQKIVVEQSAELAELRGEIANVQALAIAMS